jgi:hypothetical protein
LQVVKRADIFTCCRFFFLLNCMLTGPFVTYNYSCSTILLSRAKWLEFLIYHLPLVWMIWETSMRWISVGCLLHLWCCNFNSNFWVLCSGIIEPIKSGIRDPKLGIGKQEEDDFFTAEENIQRRKLDIEVEETEEDTKKREVCL